MQSKVRHHAIAAGIALTVSVFSLITLAHLSEYVQPAPHKAAVEAVPIQVASPPKRARQTDRPKPAKDTSVKGPELPGLDLPSMIQAPSLALQDDNASHSLVRPTLSADKSFAPVEDLVMSEELVDDPPRAILDPAPRYPAAAQSRGVEGAVTMRVLVDLQGNVSQVVMLKSLPPGVFDDAAVEAMRRWRFTPATFKKKPVQVWVKKTLTFQLE